MVEPHCRKTRWLSFCSVFLWSGILESGTFGLSRTFNLYRNHLNTTEVRYSNGQKVSGCWMVWILNGGLKIGQKCLFYSLKCPVFWMVWTIGKQNKMATIGKDNSKCVQYSSPQCTLSILEKPAVASGMFPSRLRYLSERSLVHTEDPDSIPMITSKPKSLDTRGSFSILRTRRGW